MINLLLLAEGSRFAGIESHLMTLLRAFRNRDDIRAQLAVFDRGILSKRAADLDVPVHHIPRRFKYDWQAIRRLREIIAETGVNLVHAHGYLANVSASQALANSPIPAVTTIHGAVEPFSGLAGMKMRFNMYLDRRAMRRRCRRIIVVADFLEEMLRKKGIAAEKLVAIPNGLDSTNYQPGDRAAGRAALELPPNAPVVAYVGRLEEVKNPLAFAEFAGMLQAAHPETIFTVAGDGPLYHQMRDKVQSLNLDKNFRFLGFLDDLRHLYAAADLLTLTSHHEGVPMVVLEAMQAGLPVTAPAVGGLPDLLGGFDGLLAAPANSRQLAALAGALLADQEKRRAAGNHLRELFREKYSAEVMIDRLLAVYREVAAEAS